MICPACGKKTIFDWNRCPACGVDPWVKPGTAIASSAPDADPASGVRLLARRVLRLYTQRPKLSFVFVALGTLQIALAGGGFLFGPHAGLALRDEAFLVWLLDQVWALGAAVLPGLYLLAVGEGLAYLAVISHARRRER